MILCSCVIIVDASKNIGFGHLSRCILFGKFLRSKGFSVQFLSSQNDSREIISKLGFQFNKINTSELNLDIYFKFEKGRRIVVLDINNHETFNTNENYTKFLLSIKKQSDTLLSFEDLIDFPFESDLVVIPYAGSNQLKLLGNQKSKYFLGARFFPISDDFHKRKIFSNAINSILITMGGSDPEKITLKVLRALNKSKVDIEIEVVIGGLSIITDQEIEEVSNNLRGGLKVHRNLENLNKLMNKVDLAITNSGLTKYELAYVGVPMLIISNNQIQSNYSDLFVSEVSGEHLGENNGVTEDDIISRYNSISENYKKRLKMIKKGQKMVDGSGMERIYNGLILSLK